MTTTTPTGLPVQRWAAVLRELPDVSLPTTGRVWVLAAHPDDETLGIGGSIARLVSQGADVQVIVATDGEAAYGPYASPTELAAIRRAELGTALVALGVQAEPLLLGLPDGRLAEHIDELDQGLRSLSTTPDLLLAPWTADPHPDHRAVGACARMFADRVERPLWEYPVWMRHWTDPAAVDMTQDRLQVVRLSAAEQQHKSSAIAAHASQISPQHGREPVLPAYVLTHFTDGLEPLFAPVCR